MHYVVHYIGGEWCVCYPVPGTDTLGIHGTSRSYALACAQAAELNGCAA